MNRLYGLSPQAHQLRAIGDGLTMNTEAVNLAIETCSSEGGATVIFLRASGLPDRFS
ncbi:hypothetical protein [Paenibacillus sp. LHD-38]|uniref:hypothetical protein n=1 Tax=Paenibacillus sp. LHD-38 TaxID=3072143 RepID=UPI00280E66FF|nr:hypothetical protein [Paenibacillus sp. LHD-38]MDQ8737940.1 hypothetical protein [Paenibacillus sp. LHD-38]